MRVVLIVCLFFASCVSQKRQMEHWLGQDEQDLVMTLGMPDKTTSYGRQKVLIYVSPLYNMPNGIVYRYRSFFSEKGVITGWTLRQTTTPKEEINVNVLIS